MMWKQSRTIVAFGKACVTISAMLSDMSIVTSLTFKRSASGILNRMLTTSWSLVPRTAATIVPFLPCPSLLDRKVNKYPATRSHQCSGVRRYYPQVESSRRNAPAAPILGSCSENVCMTSQDCRHQQSRTYQGNVPSPGSYPIPSFKKAANSAE